MPSALNPAAWWTDFKVALIFLTRIPLRIAHEIPGRDLARALRLAAAVGLIVGLLGGAAYWLATLLGLPPLVAGLIAVAATVVLTGALHEDGLSDLADGLGGARDRRRKLEIMRDSRIGAYGGLALILSVALRAAALAAIATPPSAIAALVAAHAVSRALLPGVMAILPLARSDGLAAQSDRPEAMHAAWALLLGVAVALLALGAGPGLAVAAIAVLAAAAIAVLARNQLGGYTGDVLGAVQQTGEVAALLAAAAVL